MSSKVEFEKWKSEKYRKERALDGGMWDSGHNSGLETGLFLALEYSELVNSHLEERLKEAEKVLSLLDIDQCGCKPICQCYSESAKLIKLECFEDEANAYLEKYK